MIQMLDIQLFREEVERIRADHDRRGLPHDNIDKVIELDTKWKGMLRETNELRRQKNCLLYTSPSPRDRG